MRRLPWRRSGFDRDVVRRDRVFAKNAKRSPVIVSLRCKAICRSIRRHVGSRSRARTRAPAKPRLLSRGRVVAQGANVRAVRDGDSEAKLLQRFDPSLIKWLGEEAYR